ncbi:MAG: AraC family transcriptional regulator [Variovorax sp.]|nr:AraC family transcriptional regulator [Variovorax sp.]
MSQAHGPSLIHWSTDDVAPAARFDYYAEVLSAAQTPMSVFSDSPRSFAAAMTMVDLGGVSVMRQSGSGNSARRVGRDIERSSERSFHLLASLATDWTMQHRGALGVRPGEAVLFDSDLPYDLSIANPYEFVHIRFTNTWMQQWVPSPAALVGRAISAEKGWGRALTAFAIQLSPQAVTESPLPPSLLLDQLGSLLALSAHERAASRSSTPGERALCERARDAVAQCSQDPSLSAAGIAAELGVSVRTMHRSLAATGETFGGVVIEARVSAAVRMLESPLFRRLATAEIGRRAGFSDPSHFVRAFRARVGQTPLQFRRSRHG